MSKFSLTFVDNWFTFEQYTRCFGGGSIGPEQPPERPPMLPGQDKGEVNLGAY